MFIRMKKKKKKKNQFHSSLLFRDIAKISQACFLGNLGMPGHSFQKDVRSL